MVTNHRHQYVYPRLRLLSLPMPDGYTRVYVSRQCRHCGAREDLTGHGTQGTERALPPMDTFWATRRTKEE